MTKYALLGVDDRTLDAGATDVDAECLHGRRLLAVPLGASSLPRPLTRCSGPRPCRSATVVVPSTHGGRHLALPIRYTVPTRYWHQLDDGRHPVRRLPAGVQAAGGPARGVLRAGAHRRPGRAHHATAARAATASTPSRRSRSTTSCPAPRCSRSAPPGCNLACRFCQNWDISKSKEIDRLADAAPARGHRRRGPSSSAARSVAFTYNDPVIFLEYAIDIADACRESGVRAVAVSAGYVHRAAARELYSPHRRGQHRPEGRSPTSSTATWPWASCSRCSTRCATSATRPTCGSRSPRC